MKRLHIKKDKTIYHLMLLPGVIFCLIFAYGPMCGIIMAFQDYNPFKGILGSRFVGLENFKYLFQMPDFNTAFFNTFYIAATKAVLFLVVPLLLALLINEVRSKRYVKIVQTSVFLPYFLSWAILGGIILEIFSLDGVINHMISFFGQDPVSFLGSNKFARTIIIWSDVWKSMGYNMIVFLAAITNIDTSLYEAASIDGAGKLKQALHITIPAMAPMIFLLTVLSLGNLLNAGFDQILMLYNPMTYETTDVLDTLVYRIGIYNQQYGIATAMGLFKSVISVTLVAVSNFVAYKFTDYRIF